MVLFEIIIICIYSYEYRIPLLHKQFIKKYNTFNLIVPVGYLNIEKNNVYFVKAVYTYPSVGFMHYKHH